MLNFSMILFAQNDGGGAAGGIVALFFMLIYAAVIIGTIAGLWKVFEKAGKPGWACIVPFYNIIVLLEIIGKPLWWIVLFFIPCVGVIMGFVIAIELAKKFGKDAMYGVGMALLPFVFYPLLGFGDAKYLGPNA
jgi:hypothetical protein